MICPANRTTGDAASRVEQRGAISQFQKHNQQRKFETGRAQCGRQAVRCSGQCHRLQRAVQRQCKVLTRHRQSGRTALKQQTASTQEKHQTAHTSPLGSTALPPNNRTTGHPPAQAHAPGATRETTFAVSACVPSLVCKATRHMQHRCRVSASRNARNRTHTPRSSAHPTPAAGTAGAVHHRHTSQEQSLTRPSAASGCRRATARAGP